MSLRKSPVRTAGMLAANRANARRSSGPRTLAGKRVSAMNALRSGFYSRAPWAGEPRSAGEKQAFEALCQTLRVAVVAARTEAGERAVREHARKIWKAKRALDHWIEWELRARRKARRRGDKTGATIRLPYRMPAPQTVTFERPRTGACPGWQVKVSIRMRWGRSPVCLGPGATNLESALAGWRLWRTRCRREHTVVSVTCTGHPWTRRHRQRLGIDSESHRKGVAWRNLIADFESGGNESGLAPADFGISAAAVGAPQRNSGLAGPHRGGVGGLRSSGAAESDSVMANEAGILQKPGHLEKCDEAPFTE